VRAETNQNNNLAEQLRAKRYIVASAIAALGLAFGATPAGSGEKPVNLKSPHPNLEMVQKGYFLDGINKFDPSGKPSRSVLWFELGDKGRFEMHNSLPPEDCHTDYYQWKKNYLSYTETSDQCEGKDRQVVILPGIGYMPRAWNLGTEWEMSGTSSETHIKFGKVVCRGIMEWRSEVIGVEKVHTGQDAVHTQTTQETKWTFGKAEDDCPAGGEQRWEENFRIDYQNGLQIGTGSALAPSLVESEGGNSDNHIRTGEWDWSVNFHGWSKGSAVRVKK